MIDGSHCKVHPHAAGAIGGNIRPWDAQKGAKHEGSYGL